MSQLQELNLSELPMAATMVAHMFFAPEMHRFLHIRPPTILTFEAMGNMSDTFGFLLLESVSTTTYQDSVPGTYLST